MLWIVDGNRSKVLLTHHAKATNARVFNEAVALEGGMVSMQYGKDTLHGKTLTDTPGDIVQTSIRECFDRLAGKTILLKLDCEGAEWEILKDRESLKRVQAITMEYHLDDEHKKDHHNSHQTIINVLESLGFTILKHAINHEYWGMAWAERPEQPFS